MAETSETEGVMRLLVKSQGMLSVFLYSIVQNWDVVDDAVQETAVFICAHAKEYTPGTDFGAWARTIARNRLRETLRARAKAGVQTPESDFSAFMSERDFEECGGYFAHRKQALAECVKKLPSNARRIIQARYEERQPVERIAAELKRNLDAVYKTLSRIRMDLRQCVERRISGSVE